MKKRRNIRYQIFSTNCDCASGTIVRQKTKERWIIGPRCPYCRKQLGWMQFAFMDELLATCPFEAEDEYERRFKAGITTFQVNRALESPEVETKKGRIMEIGNWVRTKGTFKGLPFRVYGKIIGLSEGHAKVQFPFEAYNVPVVLLAPAGKHQCTPENVGRFLDWLKNRGGIAVWNSLDLCNPAATWSAPVNDENGNPKEKPSHYAGKVIRIVTDINDIYVAVPKEWKRFHVATRMGGNGMRMKVTAGGSRRINSAKAKAAEECGDAWHEFDFEDYKNAVIFVPDTVTPLSEWEVNSGSHLKLGTMPHEVAQC